MGKAKQNWQSYVRGMLAEGYGCEDIAVKLDVQPDSVREMVKIMRRQGVLDVIFVTRRAAT